MCDFSNGADKVGFLVDNPRVRALIEQAHALMADDLSNQDRVERLKPTFAELLAADDWLPEEFMQADPDSGMGGGIGQYALYRAEDQSLCLFSLVVPTDSITPVHDHLAWGLIGLYRGEQDETIYRRLDDGSVDGMAQLEQTKRHLLKQGEFTALFPPIDDIHKIRTVSSESSISIHLLANDTACVWRHQFFPRRGTYKAFRSGYTNAPCPPEAEDSSPAS